MKYRGFNQRELNKITEILKRHSVVYEVSVPDESLEYINDKTKRVNHRFMDNLLQIEIDKTEFDKIHENDIAKLFDLRVYKEEDSPFSEEELSGMTEPDKPEIAKPDERAKMNQWAALMAISTVLLFFLWKNQFFK